VRQKAVNVPLTVAEHPRVSGSGRKAECLVGEPTCQHLSTTTIPNHPSLSAQAVRLHRCTSRRSHQFGAWRSLTSPMNAPTAASDLYGLVDLGPSASKARPDLLSPDMACWRQVSLLKGFAADAITLPTPPATSSSTSTTTRQATGRGRHHPADRTGARRGRRAGDQAPPAHGWQGRSEGRAAPRRAKGPRKCPDCLLVLDYLRDCRRPDAGSTRANRRGYHPVNPLPAKRIPAQIRSLCRAYTGEAVRSLAAMMRNADAPPRARIRAADILLDRGWGKAPQPHTGENDKAIEIILRNITEGRL
jgi:hypothetical protein